MSKTDEKAILNQCLTAGMDDAAGIFFSRELEHIKANSYDKKYAELPWRTLFPVSHEAPPGTSTITARSYDRTGLAKIIESYANDLPRADIFGKEYYSTVKSLGTSYGYSTKEIRQAQLTGKSLEARRSFAATMAHEEQMNKLAFYGDANANIIGLKNAPGVPVATVATKAATGTKWIGNATPEEILFDMNNAVDTMIVTTKMREKPTRMLLPVAQYLYIKKTPRSTNDVSGKTILTYFLETNEYITEVIPVNELAGFGTGGADTMVVYNPDPMNFTVEVPMELYQMAPQLRNLEWEIPCESEFGGMLVYYPLSLAKWEGI